MSVTVEIRRNQILRVKELTKTATTRRTNTIRRFIRDRAEQSAPVDTGFLQDNIGLVADGVASAADYSEHVEYGTYKMGAQPFMRPAVRDAENELARFFDGFEAEITSG